jgi:hypothetical protein
VFSNESFAVRTAILGQTEGSIRKKCERLGIEVVVNTPKQLTTTTLVLPKELFSVEEALKILAAALTTACQPGLDKVEVQRLQVVATIAKTYKEILADYIDYRQLEIELVELTKKYDELAKKTPNL